MEELCVTEAEEGMRLDRFLRRHIGILGQGAIERVLRAGLVRVDTAKSKSNYRLACGQTVTVSEVVFQQADSTKTTMPKQHTQKPDQARAQIEQMVLQRHQDWIALNKPAGLAVQGGTGTYHHIDGLLRAGFPERPHKLVHRIDKDTSGLLMVACSDRAARDLTTAFHDHHIRKIYLAIVTGNPPVSGRISAPLRKAGQKGAEKMVVDEDAGAQAVTDYVCVDRSGPVSLLALSPLSGRTHQLRVHTAFMGMPILGDGKYGGADAYIGGFAKQLHLHAWALKLPSGEEIFAPLATHLKQGFVQAGLEMLQSQDFPLFGFQGKGLSGNMELR